MVTDHKALLAIFGPKGIPIVCPSTCLHYTMQFKSTLAHANADKQFKLSLNDNSTIRLSTEPSIFKIAQIDCLEL